MKRAAIATDMSVSLNGHRSINDNQTANLATRYLCIASHLRGAMLPGEIIEPVTLSPRPPLAVGRTYAFRVLFGVEGRLPMPGISVPLVERHCRAALLETILRDLATIIALVTAAFLAPWSTLVTILVAAALVMLFKRVRLSSPLTIAAMTVVALALLKGWQSRQSYAVPLICLGACFLIYYVDNLWSLRQIRHLLPQESSSEAPPPGKVVVIPFEKHSALADSDTTSSPNGQENINGKSLARRVYYDKDGIIGAGTSFSPFPLTIPIDKPRDPGAGITKFTAEQLLEYIARHIKSQGVGDEQDYGYARMPGSTDGHGTRPTVHFTYGLPHLNVDTVVAAPLPAAKKHSLLRVSVRYLEVGSLSVREDSPSAHPERNYMRAITTSWDGQLVVSVYVSASLQAHYLRMVIRPYVIGPIVAELKAADELAKRNFAFCACATAGITVRQFVACAVRMRTFTTKERKRRNGEVLRPLARSTRERYAQIFVENMHQTDDADRIIRVLELKIAKATIDYLEEHNVEIGEYEAKIIYNIENHVIGGGTINSGTFTNSPVTTVTGQGNTTSATTNASSGSSSRPPTS
jgi:hypothetical protein